MAAARSSHVRPNFPWVVGFHAENGRDRPFVHQQSEYLLMLRNVSRGLLAAAVVLGASACSTATTTSEGDSAEAGGRYRVLVPQLAVQGGSPSVGASISKDLRGMISDMATHTAVPEKEVRAAMKKYNVEQMNEITARQLAQQMGAQLVMWGTVDASSGLTADVTFTDTRSGDQIVLEDVSGATDDQLAQTIFTQFQQQVEGIRQAVFCNDYLSSQQFDKALEVCEKALTIAPRSTSALYGKATALLRMEPTPERDSVALATEALRTYEQLLAIDAGRDDALLGAGLAASRLGQPDRAAGFYRQYMELNPNDPQIRMKVAGDIAKAGDYVNAYRVLEPVIESNRDDVAFQRYLLTVATAAGQAAKEKDLPEANQIFESALGAYRVLSASDSVELDASTYRQIVAVNLALGRSDEALSVAQEATTKFDTVASVWGYYGQALADAGRHAEAVRAYTRVIQIDPQYENIYLRRALANMRAGNQAAARADLERTSNKAEAAKIFLGLGGDAMKANRFADAADLFRLADQYGGSDVKSQAAFFQGYALYKQGEAIAKANSSGSAAKARQALGFFQRAIPLLERSGHAQSGQVAGAARQYIENQQAIIKAAGR